MKVLRRFAAAAAAAVVMVTGGALVAQAEDTPSVYTTPGGQISAGRLWNTTCEQYSTNVVRCRAEIWANTTVYKDGGYVVEERWVFNNLSYLSSPRASWAGNNLGRTNKNWTSGGRQWRTECDTATTGRGGCRSYVLSDAVKFVDGEYVMGKEWVFNNLVLFSSSTIPPVTKVPAWVIDQSRLSFTGLGPLQIGTPVGSLNRLGYITFRDNGACKYWDQSQALKNRGVTMTYNPDNVFHVMVDKKGIRTTDGAQIGMTVGQLRGIYGDRLKLVTKDGYNPVYTAVVTSGANELVFFNGFSLQRPLKDSDVVKMMIAREKTDWLGWDGC